jgi:hypothetical protein
MHFEPIYKYVHSLHHKSYNPGPWSGLSMHPIECVHPSDCTALHCDSLPRALSSCSPCLAHTSALLPCCLATGLDHWAGTCSTMAAC